MRHPSTFFASKKPIISVVVKNVNGTSISNGQAVCFYRIGVTYIEVKKSSYGQTNLLGANTTHQSSHGKQFGISRQAMLNGTTGIICREGFITPVDFSGTAVSNAYVVLGSTAGKVEMVTSGYTYGLRAIFGVMCASTTMFVLPWRI